MVSGASRYSGHGRSSLDERRQREQCQQQTSVDQMQPFHVRPPHEKHIDAAIFFHSRRASATIASSSFTPGAAAMIRLGIVDFDTSHVVEFTKRLNHKGIDKDQWVDGAEVTLGCPGESQLAPERIAGYKKEMESLGSN